jgi:hypothetical protein
LHINIIYWFYNINRKGELKLATDLSKIPGTSYTSQSNQDNNRGTSILNDASTFANSSDWKSIQNEYINGDLYKLALHGANLFTKDEINLYNNIYRFGLFNPYGAVTNLREYLFFTKPDLNIYKRNDVYGGLDYSNGNLQLSDGLAHQTFWKELREQRPNTIRMLQNSYSPGWNMLLQNSVITNLEIPDLEGTVTESPVNNYGVGFQYRGTSEASDDSIDFSLEFKDTKWLDIYYFFRAYEDYETLKHHGTVGPWQGYTVNRIIHDQFSIYKFMVGEDMETIVYWAKLYGVMPMGLPRSVFSTTDLSNGLSYNITFKAAFFEDMRSDILKDFNTLSDHFGNNHKYQYETYNSSIGMGDFRPAKSAYIERYTNPDSPSGWVYKLKWKGDKEF